MNLTVTQLAAMVSGQPIRQKWTIRTPINAAHSSYTETVIDDGIFSVGNTTARVIKAGSRRHHVWNPHPKMEVQPKAVRYAIEVANGDGLFHRRVGSVWNPFGLYDAAPGECFLLHNLYVWVPDPVTPYWTEITHMAYIGQVVTVDYAGTGSMNRRETGVGTTAIKEAPQVATITSEQVGAWPVLRRVFNKTDAVTGQVDGSPIGAFTFTAT